MAVAVPKEVALEKSDNSRRRLIVRTKAQEQALVERSRLQRSNDNSLIRSNTPLRAANDNFVTKESVALPKAYEKRGSTTHTQQEEEGRSEQAELAEEQARVARLRMARGQTVLASQAEAHSQVETEEQYKPKALRYFPAGTVAVMKDLLDLVAIGSVPVVGTLVTFFCTCLIFFLTIFAKENSSLEDFGFLIRRLLILFVCFVVEGFVFGVNFFPFETATVFIIYFMDKYLSNTQIAALKKVAQSIDRVKP